MPASAAPCHTRRCRAAAFPAAMGDNGGGAPSMGRKLFNAGASVTRFAGRLVLSTVRACHAAPPQP